MVPEELKQYPTVELFGVRFPILSREVAIDFVQGRVERNVTTAVCFPDMSTINLCHRFPELFAMLEEEFVPFNDGAGLEIASWLRGQRFPENLNGTDFIPALLNRLPEQSTIYLVGGKRSVAKKAHESMQKRWARLHFPEQKSGFMEREEEREFISSIRVNGPTLFLVGMGNPLQLHWIKKHIARPNLQGAVWMAVGGLLDFYGGNRPRAPEWMRKMRLEWMHILGAEHHKFSRYVLGVPYFLGLLSLYTILGRHRPKIKDKT